MFYTNDHTIATTTTAQIQHKDRMCSLLTFGSETGGGGGGAVLFFKFFVLFLVKSSLTSQFMCVDSIQLAAGPICSVQATAALKNKFSHKDSVAQPAHSLTHSISAPETPCAENEYKHARFDVSPPLMLLLLLHIV